jgi:hypothetical protein
MLCSALLLIYVEGASKSVSFQAFTAPAFQMMIVLLCFRFSHQLVYLVYYGVLEKCSTFTIRITEFGTGECWRGGQYIPLEHCNKPNTLQNVKNPRDRQTEASRLFCAGFC